MKYRLLPFSTYRILSCNFLRDFSFLSIYRYLTPIILPLMKFSLAHTEPCFATFWWISHPNIIVLSISNENVVSWYQLSNIIWSRMGNWHTIPYKDILYSYPLAHQWTSEIELWLWLYKCISYITNRNFRKSSKTLKKSNRNDNKDARVLMGIIIFFHNRN